MISDLGMLFSGLRETGSIKVVSGSCELIDSSFGGVKDLGAPTGPYNSSSVCPVLAGGVPGSGRVWFPCFDMLFFGYL